MACLGCLSPQRTATDVVDAIAIGVRPEVEKQTGEKYTRYFAVSFRSQVVAGIMYYIKIDVGDRNYIIIRVWWKVEQRFQLEGVKTNVKESDPIEPFDS
ncbi:cystatin-A-like [Clavelina lepadiformis]|uniref:cystatin-A-like n=1 Tax=Clavelina lepadiformis TaxID=159417 RepID=UPI004042E174